MHTHDTHTHTHAYILTYTHTHTVLNDRSHKATDSDQIYILALVRQSIQDLMVKMIHGQVKVHACVYIYMYICMYMYVYVCMYIYLGVGLSEHSRFDGENDSRPSQGTCVCVHIHVHMYVCIYVCIYEGMINIYTYIYIYIYIHT